MAKKNENLIQCYINSLCGYVIAKSDICTDLNCETIKLENGFLVDIFKCRYKGYCKIKINNKNYYVNDKSITLDKNKINGNIYIELIDFECKSAALSYISHLSKNNINGLYLHKCINLKNRISYTVSLDNVHDISKLKVDLYKIEKNIHNLSKKSNPHLTYGNHHHYQYQI